MPCFLFTHMVFYVNMGIIINSLLRKLVVMSLSTNIQNKNECIYFFKGVAIILVVLVHSIQRFSVPYWFSFIPSLGQLGCQIFFVLSAFSLCLGYANKTITYFNFIKRRISKMLIGYWSMIVFYLFIQIMLALRDNEAIVPILTNPGLFLNLLFLHGFHPDKSVVNGIVRGGWFVGTITILYLLFPLLYKIFNHNNTKWNKIKIAIFPLLFFILSVSFFSIYSKINPEYTFKNNSVSYFSFLNQLPCFALGFSLYEIHKRNLFGKIKHSNKTFLFFAFISIILFVLNQHFALICISFVVALAFVYAYISVQKNEFLLNKINNNSGGIVTLIKRWGEISFSIYLTHPIIVHLLMKPLLELLNNVYYNNILWYIILAPIMFISSYYLALLFNQYERIVIKILFFLQQKAKRI